MKAKIHPRYQTCNVHCACGNNFTTRSTQARINVDICSQCHPFLTGKQKFVDTARRVERCSKKFGGTYSFQKTAAAAPALLLLECTSTATSFRWWRRCAGSR